MADATTFTSKLQGTRALVVGGTSGIGFAVACGALEHGSTVLLCSSNPSRLDNALARLHALYPSKQHLTRGITVDFSDAANLETNALRLLREATHDGADQLDHIVWTAADSLHIDPDPANLTLGAIRHSALLRVHAPCILATRAGPYLRRSTTSSFTFTSGAVVQRPNAGWLAPALTFSSLTGLVKALALELQPVRFNVVEPGGVETEMWRALEPAVWEGLKAEVAKKLPVGHFARPEVSFSAVGSALFLPCFLPLALFPVIGANDDVSRRSRKRICIA